MHQLGFQAKCKGQFDTITFIKSERDLIFGAYTTHTWESCNKWKPDAKMFTFSLSKKTKHLQYMRKEEAVCNCNDNNWLMIFGSNDIRIADQCDSVRMSLSDLGRCTRAPNGYQ